MSYTNLIQNLMKSHNGERTYPAKKKHYCSWCDMDKVKGEWCDGEFTCSSCLRAEERAEARAAAEAERHAPMLADLAARTATHPLIAQGYLKVTINREALWALKDEQNQTLTCYKRNDDWMAQTQLKVEDFVGIFDIKTRTMDLNLSRP